MNCQKMGRKLCAGWSNNYLNVDILATSKLTCFLFLPELGFEILNSGGQ